MLHLIAALVVSASLMPSGKQTYTDAAGAPLAGGRVYTYAAGTSTPLATYSDRAGTVPNTNPVILDARGEATIFWAPAGYKVVLRDSADVIVWTQDEMYPPVTHGEVESALVTATGSTSARTIKDRASDDLNVKDFGAIPNDGLDDSAAFQAAIDRARTVGTVLTIDIPDGDYNLNASLNATGFGGISRLKFRGHGKSRLYTMAGLSGKAVFDCSGSGNITFEDLYIFGLQAAPPAAAFLFSRVTGNGSSGWHTLRHVFVDGYWTKADVTSISSEVNNYLDSYFYNFQPTAHVISITAQNSLGITSDYAVFPVTWAGGNTVHRFVGCVFNMPISLHSGSGVLLEEATDVSFVGSFFSGGGVAGIDIGGGGASQLQLLNSRAEWGGISQTTYGVRVKAGATLSLCDFRDYWFDGGIFGEDTSIVKDCSFIGKPEEVLATGKSIDLWNVEGSIFNTQGLGIRIRNQAYGNTFFGSLMADAAVELPTTLVGGNSRYNAPITGGDGVGRSWMDVGSDKNSRLRTNIIKPKMIQTVEQSPAYVSPYAPDLDSGAIISMTLTGDVIVNAPTGLNYNPGITGEGYGAEATFVFKQDGAGGHNVTFSASYSVLDWQPDLTPTTGVSTIRFVLSSATGKWTQVGGAKAPIRASSTVDVASIASGGCSDTAFTVTGAGAGYECAPGLPAAFPDGLIAACFPSAANTVQLRICNVTSSPIDPPSLTYTVRVFRP